MENKLNNEAVGIFQSDIIIRTAIMQALNDLRANPWLLNYAFASLAKDDLTSGTYGSQEIARAKEWFQKTNVSVIYTLNLNEPKFPCYSISLLSSQEVEQEGTLSDTHYTPFEDNNFAWLTLWGPTTPLTYSSTTGVFTVPPVDIVLAPGMIVFTVTGNKYPITDVTDAGSFTIAAGAVDNFTDMIIKSADPSYITEVESAVFREVYAIGAHADSEAVHLTYLHSVLVFILRRYAQSLLEGRGFERSTINSSDFKREGGEEPEFLYSRYCQISGSVRQSWPKTVTMKGTGILVQVQATQLGDDSNPAPVTDVSDLMDADPLDLIGG